MQSRAATVEEYISGLPTDRQIAISALRKIILRNLPRGFKEEMSYGMIGYVVPHSIYLAGYHCNPSLPLPFAGLASQKNAISFYHMGIYSNPTLLKWFTEAYEKAGVGKLDMGKSCIRFKKLENIPLQLIGELAGKLTVQDWIKIYEDALKK